MCKKCFYNENHRNACYRNTTPYTQWGDFYNKVSVWVAGWVGHGGVKKESHKDLCWYMKGKCISQGSDPNSYQMGSNSMSNKVNSWIEWNVSYSNFTLLCYPIWGPLLTTVRHTSPIFRVEHLACHVWRELREGQRQGGSGSMAHETHITMYLI